MIAEHPPHVIDRSKWGDGPWDGEPDRVEFEHAGLPCLMVRSTMGHWCGYAAVPPGHALHGAYYDKPDVNVHGGLTYSGDCGGQICHVPKPGEPDAVWWFGFDCAHLGDHSPGLRPFSGGTDGESYKTHGYVMAETMRLAEQLKVTP